MNLSDLLHDKKIDPENVLVFRHRPKEPALNKVFPLLAAERPDLFRVYEQVQTEKVEKAMSKMAGIGYIASFIAHGAGKALFIGLSKIAGSKSLTYKEYWNVPQNIELQSLGMTGLNKNRSSALWFDLKSADFYRHWKGKLIVNWPPPERSLLAQAKPSIPTAKSRAQRMPVTKIKKPIPSRGWRGTSSSSSATVGMWVYMRRYD